MNNKILIILGLFVIAAGAYFVLTPKQGPGEEATPVTEEQAHDETSGETHITWQFTSQPERDGMPQTKVVVTLNGTAYDAGTFTGSCTELGVNGGIDGKGLLAGELSAAQCWFAGGGNEIGVFAHEDGGYQIMVGELSEGEPGAGLFRGDFVIKYDILP